MAYACKGIKGFVAQREGRKKCKEVRRGKANPSYIPAKQWEGGRSLPQVKMGKKWYFVDENLKELRNTQNPSDVKKW